MKWREIKNEYEAQIERLRAQGPYELLEVSPNDTLQDIKRAYRRKVRRYHPDKTDDFMRLYSQEVVKLLNKAIEEIERIKKDEA